MNTETKIMLLKRRRTLLESRGPHNMRLIAKIDRQIRTLENNNN